MKGTSETLSYIIISSTIIIISLIVFYMAVSISNETQYILEYGQIKSILKDIAIVRFPDILRGSRVKYYFTSSNIGIGYKKIDTIYKISITGDNYNTFYTINDFYSIYASANKVLVSGRSIVFGSIDKYVVNNTDTTPLLIEYNENTGTKIELIVNKISYTVLNITNTSGSTIVVKLTIPRITKPLMYGKNVIIIHADIDDMKTTTFTDVKEFTIYLNGNKIIDSQQIFDEIGLNSADISVFQLDIVVYNIHFEIY